jgi:hypothetical protein
MTEHSAVTGGRKFGGCARVSQRSVKLRRAKDVLLAGQLKPRPGKGCDDFPSPTQQMDNRDLVFTFLPIGRFRWLRVFECHFRGAGSAPIFR